MKKPAIVITILGLLAIIAATLASRQDPQPAPAFLPKPVGKSAIGHGAPATPSLSESSMRMRTDADSRPEATK